MPSVPAGGMSGTGPSSEGGKSGGPSTAWGRPDLNWQDAAAAIAAKSEAAFSVLFYNEAADGYALTFAAYPSTGDTPKACEIVAGQQATFRDTPYWLLDVDLSSFNAGTYSVQPQLEVSEFGGRVAMVSLKSGTGAKTIFRRVAYRGELTLVNNAETLDDLKVSHPSITGSVELPVVGVQTRGCGSSTDLKTGENSTICECVKEDGFEFTCDNSAADESGTPCCLDLSAETATVSVNIEMVPVCYDLCAVTPPMGNRCLVLR